MKTRTRIGFSWALLGISIGVATAAAIRSRRMMNLKGKRVVITGGSRGLGLLLAAKFVSEGARVAICARDVDELNQAHTQLSKIRPDAELLQLSCDITSRAYAERFIRTVEDRWGGVDILVNNAGLIQVGPYQEMSFTDFEKAMAVHYWGPLYLSLAALPKMRQQKSGRIVNIASIGGKISIPHMLPYSASKFALVGLSEGLRAELQHTGIFVTTVCPGLMRTGSIAHAHFKGQHTKEYSWFGTTASLPLLSVSARHAAEQIVLASRQGRTDLIVSVPAKIAHLIHALTPGLLSEVLGCVARSLPSPGGIGQESRTGQQSRPHWLPRWTTHLSDDARKRYNQLDFKQP